MVLGATNSTLTLASAGVTDSGVYYVVVTNAYGMSISQPVTVAVGTPQLLAWGDNQYGQLGDGTTTKAFAGIRGQQCGGGGGGSGHSLYVKSDGTLWAMGYNERRPVGRRDHNQPEQCGSVASNVVAVAAGEGIPCI
jgi:hypothetical protein